MLPVYSSFSCTVLTVESYNGSRPYYAAFLTQIRCHNLAPPTTPYVSRSEGL